MFFVKKQSQNINFEFIDKVVNTYFNFVKSYASDLNGSEISELMRLSICKLLCLQTKGYSLKIDTLSDDCVKAIKPVFKGCNMDKRDIEYKQGVLEACVHCMEMSRKRAGI